MTAVSFFRTQVPVADDLVVVQYVKADRSPLACYLPGDVAGWPRETAQKLIEQGYAQLYDAGRGPGKVNQDEVVHLPEPFETGDWGSYMATQRKG